MSARFKIRKLSLIDTPPGRPWTLTDRERPYYVGPFKSLDAALLKMDNVVRAERGLLPRLNLPAAKILAAMKPTEEHTGQHLQGCISCYPVTEPTA